MLQQRIYNQKVCRALPPVSNPCAPYGAQGLDSSVLIWHHHQRQLVYRFRNAFQTTLSVVDWSHDGTVILAGSITGEVLAWRLATGVPLLANRRAHAYAPIVGVSWSPGGRYLAARTIDFTIQVWQVATRECIAILPCHRRTTHLKWSLNGNGFATNDGISWADTPELEGDCV
jgi:WD40 repeat protein